MTITPQKNKKTVVLRGFLQFLAIILIIGSCNLGTPDYRLNVTIEEGVTGTPQAGEHLQEDLSEVSFEYTAIDPIHTVEVFLNGYRQTYTGTFTMYTDVELIARLVDIRGQWEMEMLESGAIEPLNFTITIDGAGLTNGTFSDSRGNNGHWTATNGVVTVTYADWNDIVLEGSVYEMSGTYTGADGRAGIWSSDRSTSY
jgi:hypothetical protein